MTQTTSEYRVLSEEEVEACRHVPLHKLLGNQHLNKKLKIICPFHAEKTASCVLFPTGGFKCFGCGAGGNSVDFLTKCGLKYPEALRELIKYI